MFVNPTSILSEKHFGPCSLNAHLWRNMGSIVVMSLNAPVHGWEVEGL